MERDRYAMMEARRADEGGKLAWNGWMANPPFSEPNESLHQMSQVLHDQDCCEYVRILSVGKVQVMEHLRLHRYRTQPAAVQHQQQRQSLPLGILGLLIMGMGVSVLALASVMFLLL